MSEERIVALHENRQELLRMIDKYDAEISRLRLENARLQGIADRCGDVEGEFSDVISRLMDEEHSPISFACAVRDYLLKGA